MIDFPGHLAGVFFVSGCNFRCGFCHNAAFLAERREGIGWDRLKQVCREFRDNWVDAAVISGGEPTLHTGVPELIRYFRSLGWAIKLDTNGSCPEALHEWLDDVDYVAMDIKAAPSGYFELTGFDGLAAIASSVSMVKERAADYEFRTTVIESYHTAEQIKEIGRLVDGARRFVLQPFVPRDDLIDPGLRSMSRTSAECLNAARSILEPHVEEIQLRGA